MKGCIYSFGHETVTYQCFTPLNGRDKIKRIFTLVIVCLNEGALSLLVPRVVAVSVVTTDCIEKEVAAQKSV